MILETLKEFTRGGQMTMHAWRMMGQASKAVVYFTLILSIVVYLWLVMLFSDPYERYLVKERIIAEIKLEFSKDNYYRTMQIYSPDGRVGSIGIGKFVNSGGTKLAVARVKTAAIRAVMATIGCSVLILLLIIQIFIRRSKKLANGKAIRGASLVKPKELKKLICKQHMAADFKLAEVPLLKNSETQHILFTGTTGAGKSVALTELMDQVRAKKQKAIVYDGDGSFIANYYRPGVDLILNPLDERSPYWNIWQECRDAADFEAFAESLMPLHLTGGDPFWIKGSRLILSSAAFSMRKQNPTTKKLLKLLLTESLEGINQQLKNTVAETLVSDKIEKTALSVKATLSTYCKSLAYLPDETNTQELFSIRNWIRDDANAGWLFIATNKEKIAAMRPLISAWLDIAVRSVLSLPKKIERRVWFFMDELPSLYELPSLKDVLAEGRKYGACFVATIQDMHQLRTIYGREATEALLSFFNTKLCFRTGSTESASWAERSMGAQEIVEMREGFSYGANDIRDGVTLNQERRKTPVVMDAEFIKLPDLAAYLKLPGDFPITRLKFAFIKRKQVAADLVAREIQELLIDESNFPTDHAIEQLNESYGSISAKAVEDPTIILPAVAKPSNSSSSNQEQQSFGEKSNKKNFQRSKELFVKQEL